MHRHKLEIEKNLVYCAIVHKWNDVAHRKKPEMGCEDCACCKIKSANGYGNNKCKVCPIEQYDPFSCGPVVGPYMDWIRTSYFDEKGHHTSNNNPEAIKAAENMISFLQEVYDWLDMREHIPFLEADKIYSFSDLREMSNRLINFFIPF